MKIIDILNKMANDELEDGFKFKYENDIYKYNKKENEIVSDEYGACLGNYYRVESILNDEVETIEEKKEIKEIKELETLSPQSETYKSVVDNREKINEVIRVVNKINKDLEKGQTLNIEIDEETINNAIKKARNYLEKEEK